MEKNIKDPHGQFSTIMAMLLPLRLKELEHKKI